MSLPQKLTSLLPPEKYSLKGNFEKRTEKVEKCLSKVTRSKKDVRKLIEIFAEKLLLDNNFNNNRYAITFGEVALLHVGGKELGQEMRDHGFSVSELEKFHNFAAPGTTELVRLDKKLPKKLRSSELEAAVLVIRNGAEMLGLDPDELFIEQCVTEYDNMFYNARQGKTMHKRARFNVVFGDERQEHSEDYKIYTIQAFKDLPLLAEAKNNLIRLLGKKAEGLNAEGNHYYEKKSGIGFHGDAERKIVICLSLGETTVLRYAWRMPKSSEHDPDLITDLEVHHGDIYVMSEKATGYDWRQRSKIRLVHGAGDKKYIDK